MQIAFFSIDDIFLCVFSVPFFFFSFGFGMENSLISMLRWASNW